MAFKNDHAMDEFTERYMLAEMAKLGHEEVCNKVREQLATER